MTDYFRPAGYDIWSKLTVWAVSLPTVPVWQQRSEDEQGKQGRLFKDKPEGINWSNSPDNPGALLHPAIFQYIYHGPDTTLGEIWYNIFSRKAAAGMIKRDSTSNTGCSSAFTQCLPADPGLRPSTEHSQNPSDYRWTLVCTGMSQFQH